MTVTDPESLHRLFAERASTGDLEGLMSLYEDGAAFVGPDGARAVGAAAIRERLRALLELSPRISSTGAETVLAGDVALISCGWRMRFGGADAGHAGFEGMSTEVARRQADGSWRYVIDCPSAVDVAQPASVR